MPRVISLSIGVKLHLDFVDLSSFEHVLALLFAFSFEDGHWHEFWLYFPLRFCFYCINRRYFERSLWRNLCNHSLLLLSIVELLSFLLLSLFQQRSGQVKSALSTIFLYYTSSFCAHILRIHPRLAIIIEIGIETLVYNCGLY